MKPRKADRHLPACVYHKHGAYWFVKKGKWQRLANTLPEALQAYALLASPTPGAGMADLIDKALAHMSKACLILFSSDALFYPEIVLAIFRALEHNTVMDSRLARVELKEQIMKTYEIFRADINKSILTIAAADSATAFGAWASAAMLSGFIPFSGGYEYIGDERFSVRPVKAKHFIAEVREK